MVSSFKQSADQPHFFVSIDDSKLDDVSNSSYSIDGFYHLKRKEYFGLNKVESSITFDGQNDSFITIVSSGIAKTGECSFNAVADGKYDVLLDEDKFASIETSLVYDEFVSVFNEALVFVETSD